MGQFNLPKSNKMLPPKKVNAVLNMQSDAAVGMPSKVKVVAKKFDKDKDKDSRKRDTDKDMM
jgi:hypothetical protein